jgi:DNA polymerase III delta prime subunit
MAKLAMQFMKRVNIILNTENIKYESAVVAEVIQKHFPDWRRVLNELQRYAATGSIDSGILANMQDISIKELIDLLKDKNFTEIRKWVANNPDYDQNEIYRKLYEQSSIFLEATSAAQLVLIIARYQYQAAFSANPEINLVACLTEVMKDCEFQ